MVDNILEEVRVCNRCETKTFCDYCPKCGAKMPASRSMNRNLWRRTDFDQYRKKQSNQYEIVKRVVKQDQRNSQPYAKQKEMQLESKVNMKILSVIAYIVIMILFFFIFLY